MFVFFAAYYPFRLGMVRRVLIAGVEQSGAWGEAYE
jgi:hypothetical protein